MRTTSIGLTLINSAFAGLVLCTIGLIGRPAKAVDSHSAQQVVHSADLGITHQQGIAGLYAHLLLKR